MIVEKEKDRITLLFGTAEKDVMKVCLSITEKIAQASNDRHTFIDKIKVKREV